MKTIARAASSTLLVIGAILCILIVNSNAAEWTVAKAFGDVWIEGAGVQTPLLAAAVKGTKFVVTVSPIGAHVYIPQSEVEAADFLRSDQGALVPPDQAKKGNC